MDCGYFVGLLLIVSGVLFIIFLPMNSVMTKKEMEDYEVKKLSLFYCITFSLIGFFLILLQWWWNTTGYTKDIFAVLSIVITIVGVLFVLPMGRSRFRKKKTTNS